MYRYLSFLDYFVLGSYFLILIGISYFSRNIKIKSLDSRVHYFLMGRKLSLPLFVATLVSTWYGGILGVTQIAYDSGLSVFFTQGVFWYITYLLFAFFLVPKLFQNNLVSCSIMTLADLIERKVGPRSSKITAIFNLMDVLPVAYVLSLGILLQNIFNINIFTAMCFGVFFVASYTAWGGLRSVVFTDCFQFLVMFLAIFLVIFFSIYENGNIVKMWDLLPQDHKNPMGKDSTLSYLAWGFISFSTLIDPNFYSRCFAANNMKIARNGIIISTLLWIIFDICMILGAFYARCYLLTSNGTSDAYFLYAMQILPRGIKGLFIAGLASTIMSTLDSYLFTASNISVRNILKIQEKNQIIYNKFFIFIFAYLAISISGFFPGGFKQIWKFFGSLNGGCLLIPILMALMSQKKISDKIFSMSVILSALVSISWEFVLKEYTQLNIETFYVAVMINLLTWILYNLSFLLKYSR